MSRLPLFRPAWAVSSGLGAVAAVSAVGSPAADLVTTGAAVVDARLGGGVRRAALHEVYSAMPADGCAATGFALLLAVLGCGQRPVIVVREDRGEAHGGRLYAPGLAELGADPATLIVLTAPDAKGVLRAAADIVGSAAVGAVIVAPWGKAPALDLTASRRLGLAAARSGVLTLIVRSGADPAPSAAQTRWRVAAAPSRALAAGAPGFPAFDLSLLRHRGGIAGFDARVEWDRDRRSFRDAPLSRGVPAVAAGRAGDPGERRAA